MNQYLNEGCSLTGGSPLASSFFPMQAYTASEFREYYIDYLGEDLCILFVNAGGQLNC